LAEEAQWFFLKTLNNDLFWLLACCSKIFEQRFVEFILGIESIEVKRSRNVIVLGVERIPNAPDDAVVIWHDVISDVSMRGALY
jgi:hypothetical protein